MPSSTVPATMVAAFVSNKVTKASGAAESFPPNRHQHRGMRSFLQWKLKSKFASIFTNGLGEVFAAQNTTRGRFNHSGFSHESRWERRRVLSPPCPHDHGSQGFRFQMSGKRPNNTQEQGKYIQLQNQIFN